MFRKPILMFFIVLFALITFSACTSYEEKVLNDLDDLLTYVENNLTEMDADDWEEVVEDLADLADDAVECRFTSAQRDQFERLCSHVKQFISSKGAELMDQGASLLE